LKELRRKNLNWIVARSSHSKQALIDAAFQVLRIILDWVNGLLMAVAGNVVVLSSTKMGAPASREGT
jgi:hypothetical protein